MAQLTLELQNAFARLSPLIRKTTLLSANAEITAAHLGGEGASFGIIARELVMIVQELDKMILELEGLFLKLARLSATWIRAEMMLAKVQQTMLHFENGQGRNGQGSSPRLLGEPATLQLAGGAPVALLPASGNGAAKGNGNGSANSMASGNGTASRHGKETIEWGIRALSRSQAAVWSKRKAECGDLPSEKRMCEVALQCRDEIMRDMGETQVLVKRMGKFIDRISWVAVRQSHFTAITARIEAVKMSSGGREITEVAKDIRLLADEIADAERHARHQVFEVSSIAHTIAELANQ